MLRASSIALAALALAGCGSVAPADLPAPAVAPASPALSVKPAGTVAGIDSQVRRPVAAFDVAPEVDRERDRLTVAGRSVKTCREPVAAETLGRGTRVAVLCGRARMLELYDAKTLERLASASAGIGPTGLATDLVDILYVIDSLGESLLVYHQKPLELLRRVHLGGGPYAIAFDRGRWGLWITLNGANQVTNYQAGTRPILRDTYPSIRDARDVFVDAGVVTVLGQDERQVLRPRSR